MVGKGSQQHNAREFNAKNVDSERTSENVCYCNENLKEVYHELFDDAVVRFNEKQTRNDRKIDNYYEKIRTSKQEKLFHEVVVQIGNKDDMGSRTWNGSIAEIVLNDYMKEFEERNSQMKVFSSHLHMDEATPHLHIDFVPYVSNSSRGMDTRVSLKQALATQGFKGGSRNENEWSQWVSSEKKHLENHMREHNIEWEQKGTHEKHLNVLDFKKQKRLLELNSLDEDIGKRVLVIEDLVGKETRAENRVKNYKVVEEYINQLPDITTSEWLLPDPSFAMSATTYHNKHAKPLFKKLKNYIADVIATFLGLSNQYNKLKREMYQVNKLLNLTKKKYNEKEVELKKHKQKSAIYNRVEKILGKEKILDLIQKDNLKQTQQKSNDKGGFSL